MKICRFGKGRYGVVRDGNVYDVTDRVEKVIAPHRRGQRGDALYAQLGAVVADLAKADLGKPVGSAADTAFLSPVETPTKIVCAPVNYQAHIDESAADPGISMNRQVARIDQAGLFLKACSALVGAGEGVAVRFNDRRTDHEIELGIVIGRETTNVDEAHALDTVAGYAIALDMTVRGVEDRSLRKSIDSYAVLGPWFVTKDEIPDPDNLNFSLRVNGEVRQDSNTKKLIFNCRRLISWASRWYTLHPGDIIMTGTPEGVGPVADGDVMECRFDGIGEMKVKVRNAPDIAWASDAGAAAAS